MASPQTLHTYVYVYSYKLFSCIAHISYIPCLQVSSENKEILGPLQQPLIPYVPWLMQIYPLNIY